MKLFDILNENVSPEAATLSLIGHIKELSGKFANHAANFKADEGSDFRVMMELANWVTHQLQGDRKSGGIQGAIRGILPGATDAGKAELKNILDIKINAIRGKGDGKISIVHNVMGSLAKFKDLTHDDHLKAAITQMLHDFDKMETESAEMVKRQKERDGADGSVKKTGKRGRPAGARNKKAPGSDKIVGEQNKAAEEAFQGIVKSLPHSVAAKVREATARMEPAAKLAYLKNIM